MSKVRLLDYCCLCQNPLNTMEMLMPVRVIQAVDGHTHYAVRV